MSVKYTEEGEEEKKEEIWNDNKILNVHNKN
jgi:hypothetical protein